jgi:hypothetical protein
VNTNLGAELVRNSTGYFLVLVGVSIIGLGAHYKIDKLVDTGGMLVSAALLAFQAKHTPDGNTTTTQVTVPPPAIAAPVADPNA